MDTSAETLIVSNGTAYWYLKNYKHDGGENFNTSKIPSEYLPKINTINLVTIFLNSAHYLGLANILSNGIIEARYIPGYPGSGLVPDGAFISGVVIWRYS